LPTLKIRLPNNWQPRDYQLPAWEYLEQGGRHAELIWHRRSGKDDLSMHFTATAAMERVGNYWHMLPQANQARKALWDAVNPHTGLRRIDEAFPKEIRTTTREHEMMIQFTTGSTWQVVGSDNFNSLLGSPPVGLVFSEWALCDPSAWAYLMPIIEENKGWVIFNSTPRGRNHAYRSMLGAQKIPECFAQVLQADKTSIFTSEQLDAIRQSLIDTYGEEYGQSVYDQEYFCSFEAANLGAILGRSLVKAEEENRISDFHDYDPEGSPIEISSDIGRRDASSWWFWQPCVGGYRIVDHDKDSGMDAEEWCSRLAKRVEERGYKLGKIWLPHDARAKTFAAKHSAVEIFIDAFSAKRVSIVPDSKISDRINAARRVIASCGFHKAKTEKGRDGLAAWSYVYDAERREFSKDPDHNWASHDGDAFSYGALVLEERVEEVKEDNEMRGITVGTPSISLNEMWASTKSPTMRI
jgi:phage terminase large subunit